MRSISRITGVSINTVTKLLVDAGEVCAAYHDAAVRNVPSKLVQCDEIWAFCYAKQKNVEHAKAAPPGAGDLWTWTAIDSESKLIVSYQVGPRDSGMAWEFIHDLKDRLANRVQLTTDGNSMHLEAVDSAFGADVDYAMLQKIYGEAEEEERRKYSPAVCTGTRQIPVLGNPDPSTSAQATSSEAT